MDDKLMYIPNDDIQIYPFCRLNKWLKSLNTQLTKAKNQNSPVLLSQLIKERYYKTLETSVINSQSYPLSLSLSLSD